MSTGDATTQHARPMAHGTSVFWKVAGILTGALVLTGLGAVAVSAYLWETRSLELVRSSLALRLDAVAEEVEARAAFHRAPGEGATRIVLSAPLRRDLAARFPDPIGILGPDGQPEELPRGMQVPQEAAALLDEGRVVVRLEDDPGWALVPVFDPDGLPAGGLLVRPIRASLERELAGTREAMRDALWIIGILALFTALFVGAALTARLVAPLRLMTARVEAIGAGDYGARLDDRGRDELGRLALAINTMAHRVQASIEALQATDRLRRDLVANIGHDLRTPIAAAQGYLEEAERLLQEDREEEALHALATARRQSEHVERLVADLFELSVLDATAASGPQPLVREPVPLAELLHHAADMHRRPMAENGVHFLPHIPHDLPTIEADGARLLRALGNLLENACRHTSSGGSVILRAEVSDGSVTLRVEDSGEGITPEALEHVFERYYRGSSARTRGVQGSGLGLAIARAVARAHDGDLRASSTPGEGSTFELILPLDTASELAG